MNNWDKAFNNTKTKQYNGQYISTCKKCDTIVEHNTTRERQMLGNCMQVIAECNECNNVFVKNDYQNYDYFLRTFKGI
jgi:RNase P subunit RPR2